jgi:EmrB/QacA subfamily drug resistance transporter
MTVEAAERRPETTAKPPKVATTARERWILLACCVAQFMVILDLSIVNVALPHIQDSLNISFAKLPWVIDTYAITFASFLMLAGRAADQLGHRKIFVAALALFGVTSLIGGFSDVAHSSLMLFIARGVQGFSCAFMAASSLAIITSSFEPGPKLHRAIALWAAMNGLGGAAGSLFGGIITQELTWKWILWINPPIAIATGVIAWLVVRDRTREVKGFDLSGAITLTVGQIILVYGVIQAGIVSWHAAGALVPILVGFALLMLFNVIEIRWAKAPLIPFKELTGQTKAANLIVILFSAALFPMWYVSTLYLQLVLGLSPLRAGVTFLPMAVMIMVVARSAGKLVTRFGVRAVLGGGLVLMTAGMLLFTKIIAYNGGQNWDLGWIFVMIPGLLVSAGIALSIVPSTIAATQGAKPGQAGLASGLINTSRQIGGGLGIAILITLATSKITSTLGQTPNINQALTSGFRLAFYIGAGLCAAAALAAIMFVTKGEARQGSLLRRFPLVAGVAVAIGGFVAVDFSLAGNHGQPIGAYTTNGAYNFVSAPQLHPPKAVKSPDVAIPPGAKSAPGYVFMAMFYDISHPPMVGQSGPLILDNHLQPVWFRPVNQNVVAGNLSLQQYNGKPALAWWQGQITSTGNTESGEDVVVNQHYQPVATIRGKDGWLVTLHELAIRGHDIWVTANKNLPMNLSQWGGPYNGSIVDSAVQKYDLRTGKLVYSWDALKHIPLGDSYEAQVPLAPWDAYHVNSISFPSDGTFVASMRGTWAVYKVNIKTGKIVWTLGGRHSDFTFGRGARFSWQHDVQVYPGSNLVTVFDDHCCQITGGGTYVAPDGDSRGIILRLNTSAHKAALADEYIDPHENTFGPPDYMGSMQPVPGGNEFVGWGSTPFFSEFTPAGKVVMDATLPGSDVSYRTKLEPWVGQPLYPPSGAARAADGKTTVYASWNGATKVASWKVLGASSGGGFKPIGNASRTGFETPISVPAGSSRFEVQALDSSGQVIGTSRPFGVTT